MRRQEETGRNAVLACEFSFEEEGGFVGLAIVVGAAADLAEGVLLVEGDGWGAGFADFEKQASGVKNAKILQRRIQQRGGYASAAVGGVYGEVEDFGFVSGLAGHEEAGDFAQGFADKKKLVGFVRRGCKCIRKPVDCFGRPTQNLS